MFSNFYTTCHIENVSIWPRFYIKTKFKKKKKKITTPENVENIFLLKKKNWLKSKKDSLELRQPHVLSILYYWL